MRRTCAILATLLMAACIYSCGGSRSLTPAAQNQTPPPTSTPGKLDLTGWTMPDLPATIPPRPADPEGLWRRQSAAAPKGARAVGGDVGLLGGPGPFTLSAHGQPPDPPGPGDYYQYLTSDPLATIDAQNTPEVHVHGRIISQSLHSMIYAEFGLVTWQTWDFAVNQAQVPSYMFNQNVYMIVSRDNNGIPFAAPMDRNGIDYMGQAAAVSSGFGFDLWLSPNVGGTGGLMRLSINGGPYSAPFAYGLDNWGWRPPEDFSSAMLLANVYSANLEGQTGMVTIQNLAVTVGPYVPPPDVRGEWYTRGRSQTRTSESSRVGPQAGSIQWSTAANGFSLFGSPAYASDGTIYYNAGNFLYAYNPDGSPRWSYDAGEFCGRGGVTVGEDGTVYFGSSSGTSPPILHAVKPDGTVRWTFTCNAVGSLWCTPAVANGNVYFGTGNGDNTVYTLDAASGVLINSINLGITGHIGISAPAVADVGGTVYINGGSQLLALNTDGTLKWAYTFPGTVYDSPPCLAPDGTLFIGCNDGNLYAIQDNGANGSLHTAFGGGGFVAGGSGSASPVIDDLGLGAYDVYIVSNSVYAYDQAGTLRWTVPGISTPAAPAIGFDGALYITTAAAPQVQALRGSDGTTLWTLALAAQTYGSPALASDGGLYVTDMNGVLYRISDSATAVEIDNTNLSNAFFALHDWAGNTITGNLSTNIVHDATADIPLGGRFYVTFGVDSASQPSDLLLYPARPAAGTVTVNAASLTIDASLLPYFENPPGTRRLRLRAGAYNRIVNNLTSLSDALYTLHETDGAGTTISSLGGPFDTDLSAAQTIVLRQGINYRPQFAPDQYPVAGSNSLFSGRTETIYPQELTAGWFSVGPLSLGENGTGLGDYFSQAGLVNTLDPDAYCRIESDPRNPAPGLSTTYGFQDSNAIWMIPWVPGLYPVARPFDTLAVARGTAFHAVSIGWTSADVTVTAGRTLDSTSSVTLTNFLGEHLTLRALPVRVWDDPTQDDPGAAGTVLAVPGGWNVTLDFLLQYGSAPYTVEVDGDWGGAWDDGTPGRIYTASGSPFSAMAAPADHLKSATVFIPAASQPEGAYTFAVRVLDGLGGQYTFVWPGNVFLGELRGDWWMFGRDAQHTRRSPFVGAQTDNLKWTYAMGPGVAGSPTTSYDGTVYIGGRNFDLFAVNPDGTPKWSILGSNVLDSVSTAIAMDATVYASGEFGLSAIYPDGTVRWTYDTGLWTNSAPAIAPDGTIYAGGSNYILYALRPNGTLKWSHTFTDFLSYGPAIGSDGTVYIGCNDHNLYAFNPDGSLKWSYATGGGVWAPPAIDGGTVYAASLDQSLYALNPDGTLKWTFATGGALWSSPGTGPDGTVYLGSMDGKFYAVNPDGTLKWSYTTGGEVVSSPAIGADGAVYVGSRDGSIYAFNPDGSLKWTYATGFVVDSSPAIAADGTVYVANNGGILYAFGP